MKHFYTLVLLICLGLFTQLASAQLIANDDTVTVNGSGIALVGPNFFSVRSNDTYNGSPFSAGLVTFTQVSSTSAGVMLSGQNIFVQPGTPVGTYTVVYQICLVSNPSVCDTASVTVSVCFVATPTIQPNTCATPVNSITLTGLPAGNWTLTQRYNNSIDTTINGSGTSYTATGLSTSGVYQYSVANDSGCVSAFTPQQYMGYLNGLIGGMSGIYFDANFDGIINVGDQINYGITVTNLLECTMTNVDVSDSQGMMVYNGGFSLSPGASNNSMVAIYQLTQNDINAGSVSNWVGVTGTSNGYSNYTKVFTTTDLSIPSGLKFVAFYDINGDGVPSVGEDYFDQGFFTYEINNDGNVHNAYAAYTGEMTLFETNAANSYDINFVLTGSCAEQYSIPVTTYNDLTVPDNSGITTYYFPVTVVPCLDLGVMINPYIGNPRPGMTYSLYVAYYNNGNYAVPNATLTFNHDPALSMTPIPGTTPTATGFTLELTDFQPNDTQYIVVELHVPPLPSVSLGQLISNSVSVTIPSGDSDLNNHEDTLSQTITGSYDPNDKVESHGGRILFSDFTADDYLTYTIRFENTGTAIAERVVLTDVLDDKLDPETVRFADSGHVVCVMDRVDNTLTVTYDNINLPPSVPETPIGKGFFVFQVKPKPGYAVGDIIANTANIYFDTNPAIVTNTTNTEFVSELATTQFALADLIVYPNPAKSVVNFHLDSMAIKCVTIVDISGKVVMKETFNAFTATVDVSKLAKGLYFAQISSQDLSKTVKITKD